MKTHSFFAAKLVDEEFAKCDRVVVFCVLGTVEQRDCAAAGGFEQRLPYVGILAKLGEIATAELIPAVRIVMVPVAQFVAGRGILQPCLDGERFLFDAAWPQTVDEKP